MIRTTSLTRTKQSPNRADSAAINVKKLFLGRPRQLSPPFERPLQFHTTRCLEQNYVTFTCFLSQPVACFLRSRDELGLQPCFPCRFHHGLCQASHTEQKIELLLRHVAAAFAMELFSAGTELQHLACDRNVTLAWHERQGIGCSH